MAFEVREGFQKALGLVFRDFELPAFGARGNGLVHLLLDLSGANRVVELTLDGRYAITPQMRDMLETIPGIQELEEI